MNRLLVKCPTIIEFNGLPGTGKTTIAKKLGEVLTDSGLNVVYYSDYYKTYCHNRIKQVLGVCSHPFLTIKYSMLLFNLTRGCHLKKLNKKYILASILNFPGKITLANRRDIDTIIVDQGIVQEILSIFHSVDTDADFSAVFKFLHQEFATLMIVNVDLDIDKNQERINKRQDGASWYDGMKDLEIQKQEFISEGITINKIRSHNTLVRAVSIVSERIDDNVSDIIKMVNKKE